MACRPLNPFLRRAEERRRGRGRRLGLCALGAGLAAGALAAEPPPAPAADLAWRLASAGAMALMLDVQLNGQPRGLASFQWREGALWALPQALIELGFRASAVSADLQRVEALPGVTVNYDAARQQVHLTAPLELLALQTTVIDTQVQQARTASASPGVLLNYDLFATRGRAGATSLSAFTELRAFSGQSVFSSTGLTRRQRSSSAEPWLDESVRLDSTLSYSLPDSMVTVRVGDTLTGALPWSRATRIGGIQVARNFGLQPYRATAPLPSFIGSATLPSDVELFINGVRHYSGRVPPGPFELQTLPTINAAGTAQVVLTDALGRATTLDFSLYEQGRLLAPGLSDWSAELGWVRKNYGLRSFDYASDVSVSGVWRRGISDALTVEAHGEATRGLALAGAGAVWQLGTFGLVSGAVSRSAHDAGQGTQWQGAYTWRQGVWSLGLSASRTQGDYRDVAALSGSAPPRGVGRASVGFSAREWGSFSLSYLYLRPQGEAAARYASLNWFRSLGRSTSLSVGFNQNLDRRQDRSLFLNLSWSWDGATSLSAGVQRDGARTSATASAQSAPPTEGGWGWRVAGRAGDGGSTSGGQGELSYLARQGRVQAGFSDMGGGSRYGWLGGSGAVVLMGGGELLAARRIDDAFALVSTGDVAGVPVKLENRPMGQTDARGLLLVVPVNAYQNNRLAIDPMQLPADMRIDRTEALVTPTDRAGVQVRFAIAPLRAASVRLVDAQGEPLPLGSHVSANGDGGAAARVGHDGLVYLDNLQESNMLDVRTPQGTCRLALRWQRGEGGALPQLGPLRCVPQGAP